MAKDEAKTRNKVTELPPPALDGWEKVQIDRPFYVAAACLSVPLQGYLLNHEEMPPSDMGPWSAFIFKTTAECLVVPRDEVGDEDNTNAEPVKVPPGTEVMVKATMDLKRALFRYLVPGSIIEVRVQPIEKVKIGKKTKWTYDIRANTSSAKPRPPLHPYRSPERKRPADDDIPF